MTAPDRLRHRMLARSPALTLDARPATGVPIAAAPPPARPTAPRTLVRSAEIAPDFDDFYASHWDGAVRLAYLLCSSTDAAEEIAQEAFVRVHLKWERIDHPPAYLRKAIVNKCRDGFRRRARWDARVHLLADAASVEPDGLTVELLNALECLPARQRAAIVLRYWGGLDEHEIAITLGVQDNTVRTLVHRGIQRLRTGAFREELGGNP